MVLHCLLLLLRPLRKRGIIEIAPDYKWSFERGGRIRTHKKFGVMEFQIRFSVWVVVVWGVEKNGGKKSSQLILHLKETPSLCSEGELIFCAPFG